MKYKKRAIKRGPVLSPESQDVRCEAAWCIGNALTNGSDDQVMYIGNLGVIAPLCGILTVHDERILQALLRLGANVLYVSLYMFVGTSSAVECR